ncbi:MAG: hypothetical protein M2R45_03514 [Verrucomicrobia subdivision 3 bacterium]|nr:hypothetical protein [Limisphaerales bacterium]MCS1415911.1 hypothetical protein [Limisphaerales bacterium]
MAFFGNLLNPVVTDGTISVLVPFFQVLLRVIEAIQTIAPIEVLASVRSIPVDQLFLAFLKLNFFMGLPLAGLGMHLFSRNG